MSKHSQEDLLASLKPIAYLKVMDLVAEAGIDVGPWAIKQDGTPVPNPRRNPNYCSKWAFGGTDEPIALCVWHIRLNIAGDQIEFADNLRKAALDLDVVSLDSRQAKDVRQRAKAQAKHAREFDLKVQEAFRRSLPIRLIIVDGKRAPENTLGYESSSVQRRLLDPQPWHVGDYDDNSGSLLLVRGEVLSIPSRDEDPFVDQFSFPDTPERKEASVTTFKRSADVRRTVLKRANGACECCKAAGFETATGRIYLETHHVISLSEGGPDTEWNVVALCPNDHRRAHYASNREEIRELLLAHLTGKFPTEVAALGKAFRMHG